MKDFIMFNGRMEPAEIVSESIGDLSGFSINLLERDIRITLFAEQLYEAIDEKTKGECDECRL